MSKVSPTSSDGRTLSFQCLNHGSTSRAGTNDQLLAKVLHVHDCHCQIEVTMRVCEAGGLSAHEAVNQLMGIYWSLDDIYDQTGH